MKKTLKQWEKSDLDLGEFLGDIPCQIDEDLANYIGEATSPQYLSPYFTQMGEATFEKYGINHYISLSQLDGKYYYLGILPEFNQL